ncbi:MAG: JDVT-CTERM system glutamic-type intramembrane protease [Burkholderiales bacterium]
MSRLLAMPERGLLTGGTAFIALGLLVLDLPLTLRAGVLIVLAPLTEELVFRAGLHESLLRGLRAPWVANTLTALVFALAHVLARGEAAAFGVALPALLVGIVYQRWRRVWPCVLLHAAMNAIWLAI